MTRRIRFAPIFAPMLALALLLDGAHLHAQPPPPTLGPTLAQAKADVAAGRFSEALTRLQAQPNVNSDATLRHAMADAQFAWGRDLLTHSQYTQAISHYQAAATLNKGDRPDKSGDDLRFVGACYERLSQYAPAIDDFRRALAVQKQAGDPEGEVFDLDDLGAAYGDLSQYAKAVDCYQQALTISRQVGDRKHEAGVLSNLGATYDDLSQYARAIDCYQQALAIHRQDGDQGGEARDLKHLGDTSRETSRYAQAVDFYQQALPLFQQAGDQSGEAADLKGLGAAYTNLGQYAKAADFCRQALALDRQADDQAGAAGDLINLAVTYEYLRQYDKAVDSFQQALTLFRQVGDRQKEAQTLDALDTVYMSLGQFAQVITYAQQALAVSRQIRDRAEESKALAILSTSYSGLGQPDKAIAAAQQALILSRQTQNRGDEKLALSSLSVTYIALGQWDRAADYTQQALLIDRQIGDRSSEARTLGDLMFLWMTQKQPRLAVFYGKQAVNVLQGIRGGLQGLDQKTQQAYLLSVSGTYHRLADLLIGQGRLPEAEQILTMLKQQEQSEYLRGAEALPGVPGQVDLTPPEADAERQYQQIADQVTALGRQQQALTDRKKKGDTLPPADQARLDDVTRKLAAADAHLSLFLGRLGTVFGGDTAGEKSLQTRLAAINNASDLQDTLRQLHDQGQDVVVLETLVAPDRFAVIVTTAASQKVEQSPIAAADFNKAVAALQGALRDPHADPTGPAQALYRIVFAPVEADLAQAHAQTLMWSLDGSLRYVPVAALYDGKQYLVERFDNEVFTLGSQTGLGGDEHKAWNALGLGVTQAHTVDDPSGGSPLQFPALDNVQGELNGVVKGDGHPGGALPGTLLLDPQFTQQAMTDDLQSQRYNVVHIASHFALHPGDLGASFLLLGDGSPWSLADLSHQRTLFAGVDLLALSACDTASGGTDGDGREVDSLGSVAQRDGAKSVLASLWPVADASTQMLMQSFYRWHQDHPADSKAEALRQAQLALLRGTAPAPASPTRGTAPDDTSAGPPAPLFTPDPKAPYAHPFYWAPFVLIGNWR